MKDLIGERNSVFHEGKTNKYSSSFLADASQTLAREVINQIRINIESKKWKTKDDLIDWVEIQSKKLSE